MRARPACSEVSGRGRAPARGREEWPLDHLRCDHAALPHQLAVEIDVSPQRRADSAVRRLDDGEREVALAGRRPGRRGDTARLAPPRARGIQQRVVGGLVAGYVEPDECAAWPARAFGQQRTAAGEVTLGEVDEPREPELERGAL